MKKKKFLNKKHLKNETLNKFIKNNSDNLRDINKNNNLNDGVIQNNVIVNNNIINYKYEINNNDIKGYNFYKELDKEELLKIVINKDKIIESRDKDIANLKTIINEKNEEINIFNKTIKNNELEISFQKRYY